MSSPKITTMFGFFVLAAGLLAAFLSWAWTSAASRPSAAHTATPHLVKRILFILIFSSWFAGCVCVPASRHAVAARGVGPVQPPSSAAERWLCGVYHRASKSASEAAITLSDGV